jgi:hypothetical protein
MQQKGLKKVMEGWESGKDSLQTFFPLPKRLTLIRNKAENYSSVV